MRSGFDGVFPVGDRHLHLWRARREVTDFMYGELRGLLSLDERQRASRYRLDGHRRAFVVSRGWLRILLAAYLRTAPQRIVFAYNANGKPYLRGQKIQFNLTHSDDVVAYVFAREHIVGVDVEHVRSFEAADALAARFFMPAEYADWRSLDSSRRLEGFFVWWTRKEAYLKAIGQGLSARRASVGNAVDEDDERTAQWSMVDFVPFEGYVGAIAAPGHDWRIDIFSGLPGEQSHFVQQPTGCMPADRVACVGVSAASSGP